jgi:hypothetical protein
MSRVRLWQTRLLVLSLWSGITFAMRGNVLAQEMATLDGFVKNPKIH